MRIIYLFLALWLLSLPAKAQLTFQKTYYGQGIEDFDFGQAIQKTADGGYILTGTTATGNGPSDLYLIKTTADGTIEWAKAYGGPGNEEGHDVKQTADGGYIAVGNSDTRITGGDWDTYVVKTSANGTLQWAKTIGNENIEEGDAIVQTSDGGYVIAGRATGSGGLSMSLVKLASNGSLVWAKTYGTASSTDLAEAVKQTADGGFILAGSTTIHGSYDVFLVKTTADGTLQWTKTFGDSLMDMGYDVAQTTDGGYIVTGTYGTSYTDSLSTTYYGDVYLIKTNAEGGLLWSKTYGKRMEFGTGYSVQQHPDGGYAVAANRNGAYLMKTDAVGSLLWSQKYGGMIGTTGQQAAQITNDGGYIFLGSVMNAATGFDIYLVKTDAQGQSGCQEVPAITQVDSVSGTGTGGAVQNLVLAINDLASPTTTAGLSTTLCSTAGLEEAREKEHFRLYPNPAVSHFTLETKQELSNATITLYNASGRLVRRLDRLNGHAWQLNRENLAAGIYYVQLREDNQLFSVVKLVVIDR